MLGNSKVIIKCVLNMYFSYGYRARGALRLDRYNLNVNQNVTDKQIQDFMQAVSNLTGYYPVKYSINDVPQRKKDNQTRAVVVLREPTEKTNPVNMQLRVKPAFPTKENIEALQKAFTSLMGVI